MPSDSQSTGTSPVLAQEKGRKALWWLGPQPGAGWHSAPHEAAATRRSAGVGANLGLGGDGEAGGGDGEPARGARPVLTPTSPRDAQPEEWTPYCHPCCVQEAPSLGECQIWGPPHLQRWGVVVGREARSLHQQARATLTVSLLSHQVDGGASQHSTASILAR